MSTTLGYYLVNEYNDSCDKNDYFYFSKRLFWVPPFHSSYRRVSVFDECAICMMSFLNFSKTWVTQCGHVFHKHCLHAYMKKQLLCDDYARCPLCRRSMGNLEFLDGLTYQVGIKSDCVSDVLEEVPNMLPHVCPNSDDHSHYLGMCTSCDDCGLWRNGVSKTKSCLS